jgi:hypothetical protein
VHARYARNFPTSTAPRWIGRVKQVRDRLVLDFVGHQRGAVKDTEDRHDEAQEEHPDHHAKNAEPGDPLPVDAQRRHAERFDGLDDQREHHRAADDERHEDGASRPQHLAQRKIEDAARGFEERHAAEGPRRGGRRSLLHQELEHGLQVVVGRLHFVDLAGLAARGRARSVAHRNYRGAPSRRPPHPSRTSC